MPNTKQKIHIIKQFGKLFKDAESIDEKSKPIPLAKQKVYTDKHMILGIVPLKQWVVDSLKHFDVEIMNDSYKKWSESLNFTTENGVAKAKYSTEYLSIILDLAKHYDSIYLELKKDYPLRVTTPDFIVVIAPRVETE